MNLIETFGICSREYLGPIQMKFNIQVGLFVCQLVYLPTEKLKYQLPIEGFA